MMEILQIECRRWLSWSFLLTAPHPLPALSYGADSWKSPRKEKVCGETERASSCCKIKSNVYYYIYCNTECQHPKKFLARFFTRIHVQQAQVSAQSD